MQHRTTSFAQGIVKSLVNATLFRRTRRQLHGAIEEALAGCRTIIDVAAGDDRLYITLAARPDVEWILLNDLDVRALRRAAHPHPKVSRLCADAATLDVLRYRFDAGLVKNVLHHLTDKAGIQRLLRSVRRVARRVVLVEIEDPDAAAVPRLLHRYYYRGLLGEQDNEDLFFGCDAKVFPDTRPSVRSIRTLLGRYSLCRLDFPSPLAEVT
jgi:ubiquinone/menaquinone biosynthesis C-methylase UbiE